MAEETEQPEMVAEAEPTEAETALETLETVIAPNDEDVARGEEAMEAYLHSIDSDEEEIGVNADQLAETEPADPEPGEEEEPDTASDEEEVREQPKAKEPSPELEKALGALRRDGLPQSLIDKMSDDEILNYGDKRSKVQGDTDDAYRQLTELKKTQETAPESSEESEALAEPADQPPAVNLQDAVKPFAEIFGDDAAEALQQVTAAAVQPYREQLASQQVALEGFLMREARTELQGQFPSLATDEGFVSVQDRMQTLVKSGDYGDITALMSDACRLAFAGEGGPSSKEQQTRLAQTKAGGQPTVDGVRVSHEGPPMTDDERDDAILRAIEGGTNPTDVQRLYSR